jgi:hypothetical protein
MDAWQHSLPNELSDPRFPRLCHGPIVPLAPATLPRFFANSIQRSAPSEVPLGRHWPRRGLWFGCGRR